MKQPVILVSCASASLHHLVLHQTYERLYAVVTVDTIDQARGHLDLLLQQQIPVALIVVAPERCDVLALAAQTYPCAKRIMVSDSDQPLALDLLQQLPPLDAQLHLPYEDMSPLIDDVLAQWQSEQASEDADVLVLGPEHSLRVHNVTTFLAGHGVSYQYQISAEEEDRLPQVQLPDGCLLHDPSTIQLAQALGFSSRPRRDVYDLVVVGAGPAGLTAVIYAASEGLETLLVERAYPGGQAGSSSRLENFPGFPVGISGPSLAKRLVAQARRLGVELLSPQEVVSLSLAEKTSNTPCNWTKRLQFSSGSSVCAKAVLLATGLAYRTLTVPGVCALNGNGIFYGASLSEAPGCTGKDIHVVGGANSAGQAALYFSRYARTVTMLVRGPSLEREMSHYLIDEIRARKNISVRVQTTVTAVHGSDAIEALTVTNPVEGTTRVSTGGLFVFIGSSPSTAWLDSIRCDDHGFVLSDEDMLNASAFGWPLDRVPLRLETNLPGVFVAGDVHAGSLKRAVTSAGEGALAIASVHQFLALLHPTLSPGVQVR